MPESYQHKLSRNRPPRVHMTYDVHVGDATEKKELPFVVGVLGDFSGDPTAPLKKLGERKFVNIDRDNFDQVMSTLNAGLNLKVENTLQGDGSEMPVELKFRSMADFDPANLVNQVEPLKRLMEVREQLKQLQAQADRSPDMEEKLDELLRATEEALASAKGGES